MSNELAKYAVVIDETVSCFAVICIQKKMSACLQLTNMIYCYMQLCAFDCLSFINCGTTCGILAYDLYGDFRGVLSEIPVNSALFFLNDWSFYEYIRLPTLGVI